MTHKTQMELDLDAILNTDEFAESVSYVTGSATISTKCFIDIGDEMTQGLIGSSAAAVATIRVKKSAVADPVIDDIATVNGVSWRIVHVLREDAGLWVLVGVREERMVAR